MENNNDMSLEEIMEKEPRKAPIDLTNGKVTLENDKEGKKEVKVIEDYNMKNFNFDEMESVEATDILPSKPKLKRAEDDLFAELDAAVDRECESITKRVEAITKAQDEELIAMAKEKEEEKQNLEDAEALNPTYKHEDFNFNNTDEEDLGIYEESDDTNSTEIEQEEIVNTNTISAINNKDSDKDYTDTKAFEEKDISSTIPTNSNNENSILDGVKDDELFDDEDDLFNDESSDEDERDVNAMVEELKKEAKTKTSAIKKTLDLSKFKISTKAVNAQKAMKLSAQTRLNVADWVLLSAERPISATGLSGAEILKLNPDNSNRNRLNTFRDMYRIIYEHIYDANKPEFETWLKQTRFVDLTHIYFALYMATFGGSNFINYECPNCHKVFLKDIKFEDMVKYADDDLKEKVRNILKMDTQTLSNDTYESDLFQISDSYAFALRTPSIWNVIIETASLNDRFLEKHADLIDVVSYIDAIYVIDETDNKLIPIDTKPDRNDQAKTSARRIKIFHDIISQLSSEEYYNLRHFIQTYDEDAGKLSYQIPSCTCPDCATEIKVRDTSPDELIFTRHQLAAIGNM